MKQIVRDIISAGLLVFFVGGPIYLNTHYGFSMWFLLLGIFLASSVRYKNDFPECQCQKTLNEKETK